MGASQIVIYVLAAAFVFAFLARVIRVARMPIHLRWELYPLAGETQRPWGGSYLEDPDWWRKPREEKSFIAEMGFVGREILFFKEYFHRNRSLWYIVYPFHIGIFLLVGFFVLLFVGSLMMVGDVAVSAESANAAGKAIHYATLVVGIAGLALGAVGCLALLVRKLTDQTMIPYTRRVEYFNIVVVLAVFVTGLLAWGIADIGFETAREYMKSLITFNGMENLPALIAAHTILLAFLLAYLPYTNMMHFFAKYFTYHRVRWDDAPNLRGSSLERGLRPLLEQRVSWAAPHMQTIDKWGDIANEKIGTDATGHIVRKGRS
jgi:nitrate reductase gamma subunit